MRRYILLLTVKMLIGCGWSLTKIIPFISDVPVLLRKYSAIQVIKLMVEYYEAISNCRIFYAISVRTK